MAAWKYACKTIQGMNLDLKILGREGESLTLTGAWSGSGYVNPTKLVTLTDIDQRVQKINLLDAVEFLDENTIRIPVILKNTEVQQRYSMYQIGIFAEDPDLGEILYIVLQSDSEEEIPSNIEVKDFTLEWYLNISLSNTKDVEVIIDETCNLTVKQGDARYVKQKNLSKAVEDAEITFSEAESRENISSGEKLSTLFGKIRKLFADLKTVAFTGSYKDLIDKPEIPTAVAVKGNAETSYRTGNVNLTPANIGAAPTSHASSATTYGVSTAANYGHAMATSTAPKANGTAAVGSETAKFARGDHVHPLQTSVSGSSGSCTGNAATATKLATARTIRTNLASTSTASFDGSANITPGVTGTLPVANGGTGKTTLTSGQVLVGNGTGAISQREIDTTAGGTQDSTALITSGAVYDGMCYKSISITGTGNLSISSIFSGDYSDLSITLYATDNSNARNMYTWFIPTATIPSSGNLHLISGYKSGNYEGIGDVLITGRTTAKIVSCIFGGVQYNTTARLVIRYR